MSAAVALSAAVGEPGRPGALWNELYCAESGQRRLREVLSLRNAAERIALMDLGCTVAPAGALGPDTECVILPVGLAYALDAVIPQECSRSLSVMGLSDHVPMDGPDHVLDIIAMPLDGSPAFSLGGTGAVGTFVVAEDGVCRLLTSGLGFLRRHQLRVEAMRGECPDHLAARFVGPPHGFETLIVERRRFEWRLAAPGCVVPRGKDVRIACVDSRELAVWLASEMRKREPLRASPQVMGPKT